MARYWQHGDPIRAVATCNRRQAEALESFDHHRVIVDELWGILLTYHWMPIEEAPPPWVAIVVFHPAPSHVTAEAHVRAIVAKHPPAPPGVQAIIDQLEFRPPEPGG
ncbi:MAG: hypothetical protein QM820_00665 [Minicystis sp.]